MTKQTNKKLIHLAVERGDQRVALSGIHIPLVSTK